MTALAVSSLIALVAGTFAGFAAYRWGPRDPGAPSVPVEAIEREVLRHPRLRAWLRSRRDPSVLTGWALTLTALLVVVGFAAVGVLVVMVRDHAGFAHWDLSAARWGAAHASNLSTQTLRKVTQLGGAVVLVPLSLVVLVVAWRRRRGWWHAAGFLLLCVGGQFLVANIIKDVVARARPDVLRLTGFSGASFPSGHATASAASLAAFALLLTVGRSRAARAVAAGLAVGLTILIGESRVLLGVHWFTDVLGGWALGWGWFALCSIIFGGRLVRFGAPAVVAEATADHPAQALASGRGGLGPEPFEVAAPVDG